MLIQNLNRIVSKPNVTTGQILHCTTNWIPINSMFKENFPTNTQVWNSLSLAMTDNREEWSELPMGATCTKSGTSDIRRLPHAWVGLTMRHSWVVKGSNTTMDHGHRTQPLLMIAIQITQKQKKGKHILCLHGSNLC